MTSRPSFMKVIENEENAMLYPELSETVFDAVYEVHRELGPAWSQIYDLLLGHATGVCWSCLTRMR
jgi:lysyl-tRNA synthetase class I